MKKLAFVVMLWSLCSVAAAFEAHVRYYLTDIGARHEPRLLIENHFDNGTRRIESTAGRSVIIKSECIDIDLRKDHGIENAGKGMVIKASDGDEAHDTWWSLPYAAENGVQKFCLNSKFSYNLTVYWEDRATGDTLSARNAIHFDLYQSEHVAVDFKAIKRTKRILISPEFFDAAVSCSQAFCTDQGYLAPETKSVTVDKASKQIVVRLGDVPPTDWFNGDVSGATHLCLRSATAGWAGIVPGYCVLVVLNQELRLSLPFDANQSIVDEEFTFTLETPHGSVWSNNLVVFNFTTGLTLPGDNFRVVP